MKKEALLISLVLGLLILGGTISANGESLSLDNITADGVKKGYYRDRERHELKPVTPREASENLTKPDQKLWAINVLSVQNPASITPYIGLLTRNGFHAYVTMVELNGKEWTRLRAGFFEDRVEAEIKMEVIKSLLGMTSSPWLSRSAVP